MMMLRTAECNCGTTALPLLLEPCVDEVVAFKHADKALAAGLHNNWIDEGDCELVKPN